jgi:SEC-C motif
MQERPDRIEQSIRAMRERYPQFKVNRHDLNATSWHGILQAIRTNRRLAELLYDVDNDRPIYVQFGGEVVHEPTCRASHESPEWMSRLQDPYTTYRVGVTYGGGKAHPRCCVLSPLLTKRNQPHVFSDRAVCPYPPWQDVWRWDRNTVADFMDHVLVWLIKQTVWDQTGVWIGSEMQHDRIFLDHAVGRNQQCWCGSGKKRKQCHPDR